jgi:hypothetical protein
MATHELYVGGPPTRKYSQAMYPAVAFNDAIAPFNEIGPAAHKGPIGYNLTRRLDFSGDRALAEFLRENTVTDADVLGLVIIPRCVLFLGFYYKVVTPKDGVTLTPRLRGKATSFAAIDASVAAEGFVAPGGGALVTEGAVTLAGVQFDIKPDILDMTLTAVPDSGLSGLVMIVSPVVLSTDAGGYS